MTSAKFGVATTRSVPVRDAQYRGWSEEAWNLNLRSAEPHTLLQKSRASIDLAPNLTFKTIKPPAWAADLPVNPVEESA